MIHFDKTLDDAVDRSRTPRLPRWAAWILALAILGATAAWVAQRLGDLASTKRPPGPPAANPAKSPPALGR